MSGPTAREARERAPRTRRRGAPRPGTALDSWLWRQARREQRVVTLEDALLGHREVAYGSYRLRFFFLRCLSSAALHVVRLTLLRVVFSHQAFLTTLVLNAIASLVVSFWWGALEVLRARVRKLLREGERPRISAEISRWLALAAVPALFALVLPAGWIASEMLLRRSPIPSVLHLYVFAIGLRLAADLLTLTLHSGVYAVRRVYRPLPAMVGVELAGFAVVLALWPWIGRWSFPVATLASTLLSSALVVHYTARLYRLLGWLPLRWPQPLLPALRLRSGLAELVGAGASYALMKMDAFLMLAMFHARGEAADGVSFFLLFVAIAPAVQAAFDWAQILYFDLKRLNGTSLAALRRKYERFSHRLAWVVALVLWALGCALGTAVTRRNLGHIYWLLAPFFLCRSLLAVVQVQAFAKRHYGWLLGTGAVLLAAIIGLQVLAHGPADRLLGLAVASLAVAGLLRVRARVARDERGERVLPAREWLEQLGALREPVRLRSLRLADGEPPGLRVSARDRLAMGRWRRRRMARRAARRLGAGGAVTLIHPDRLAWYETRRARALDDRTFLRWGGGLVHSTAGTGMARDGWEALRAARAVGVPLWRSWGWMGLDGDIAGVRQAFAAMVPRGVIYSPEEQVPSMLEKVSARERRAVFSEAVHFARHLHSSARRCPFDVTSFCSRGEIRLVFVVDRRVDPRHRRRWRAHIMAMNLAAARSPENDRGEASRPAPSRETRLAKPVASPSGVERR